MRLSNENGSRFRMRELERRSGLPRTTIHMYLREGLLQPPDKTAVNTGLYGLQHLDRLELIQRLRSPEFGKLSIARVHRVLDRVDKGVSPEVAAQLERAVTFATSAVGDSDSMSLAEVSRKGGLSQSHVLAMVDNGLLIPDPFERDRGFDGTDATVAGLLDAALRVSGLDIADLAPVADHIKRAVSHEVKLRNRAVKGLVGEDNAKITLSLQRAANLLHQYLFSRLLEREISEMARQKQGRLLGQVS